MIEGGPLPIERGPRQEELNINIHTLYFDNHSPEADEARARWNETRIKGELNAFDRCSDARLKTVGESISVGNISAASLPNREVITDRGHNSLTALSHIDGDTIAETETTYTVNDDPTALKGDIDTAFTGRGKMPTGCGGLAAKETIGSTPQGEGSGRYVSEKIFHKDAAVQALVTAERLAYSSDGKPVLAATQDHLTYAMYPIAFFQEIRGQMTSISAVRTEDIVNYNPERIYENGIPTIEEGRLPDVLAQMLETNRHEAEGIFALYPDLKKLQKVQKPRMILFSTDIRSARVRFPTISKPPGSVFKVHVPREKSSDNVRVREADLELALDQLHYPIDHAVKNHGDSSLPFSNTDRLIIETGDIDLSTELARQALDKPWMKKWSQLPDRAIIVAQTNAGIINDIRLIAA